jgi:hypothetical protein
VGGGSGNTASGTFSTVAGGSQNSASGALAFVPGGNENSASGSRSFAAGHRAKSIHDGSFVWADFVITDFTSSSHNQFLVRANGGAVIGAGANDPQGHRLRVEGTVKADGGFVGDGSQLTGVAKLNENNYFSGELTSNGKIAVDAEGLNNGTIVGTGATGGGSLLFGGWGENTGEGIASKRTSGGNQFGLDFYTSYQPRLSIRNNGQVGIGTNSPTDRLHLVGTGTRARAESTDTSFAGFVAKNSVAEWFTGVSGSGGSWSLFQNAPTSVGRLEVNTSGHLGIGRTPVSRLHIKQSVDGTAFADSTGGIRLERAGNGNYWQIENWSDNDLSFRHSGGAAFFYMSDTAGTISIASDRRLKKDIVPLAPMLERVRALNPVSFRYKPVAETEPSTFGFIAQEVEEILPELVGQKGEYKVLNLDGLIPVTIAAVQELDHKVENESAELRSEVAGLRRENAELKARLDRLEQLLLKGK